MSARALLLLLLASWALSEAGEAHNAQKEVDTAEEMAVFKDFMVTFNRSYGSDKELQQRFEIFQQNLARARHLQATDQGTAQYGVTEFSDFTEEEFLGLQRSPKTMPSQTLPRVFNERLQKTCDWRKLGVANNVKHQGLNCRSCWAFAAASNIDSLWAIAGYPRNVSVQELIDCDTCASRDGCNGAWVWDAFMTVLQRGGLSSANDYPYKGKKGTCKKRKGDAVAWIHDFAMLEKNETAMAEYVAFKGPITVTINKTLLQNYKHGIAKPPASQCSSVSEDHTVLLVGYGVLRYKRIPYWILQNSWGPTWGEMGYFRMHRGSNTCGIAKYPVTAILDIATDARCPQ
ncbi:cathepsin W [Ambystoma mexicanum]|uniref:cathepsin W n=1 Tax=Ambystoma mexicanum TaxID=8296 RepID=UPI0037E954B6